MRLWLGACLLGACFLAACSASPGPGPFGSSGTPGSECAWVRPGGVLSYGFDQFRDTSSQTATITKISLASPHGLRMLDAWVIPITGHWLYGVMPGYPPVTPMQPGVQWVQRQRADGAMIQPTHKSRVINILVVLKPQHKTGSARGLDVYYRVGGTPYLLKTSTKIIVWTQGARHNCGS